jgi:hypothetical protein
MPSGRYLIAMGDVLGFTNLVAATRLDEIYERYMALRAQLEPSPLFRMKPGTYEREIVLNRVVFSDTILWWAPEGETVELLPHVIGQIMAGAVGSMPLRAGLAFGECVIDPANEIYIGQPIIDAYRTEQAQEWMGGAFHPSCWTLPGLRDTLCRGYERSAVEYPVPVKTGVPPLTYALNWPALAAPDFSVDILTAAETHAAPPAKQKWRNARRFYDTVVANRSGASRPRR